MSEGFHWVLEVSIKPGELDNFKAVREDEKSPAGAGQKFRLADTRNCVPVG